MFPLTLSRENRTLGKTKLTGFPRNLTSSAFKRRLSLIVQVNVVLNRTVVVDSDFRFDNLCGRWFLPDVFGTWVEGPTVDHVGNFSQERSPLFFSERLILTYTVEGLPDRLDQRFDNPVLVTCSVIREIEGSVRKNPVIENSVLYLFFK